MGVKRDSLCVATSQRVFLTAHLLYFTFPPLHPQKCWRQTAIYNNSTMEVVEEVRLAKDIHWRLCRQDKKSRFVPRVSVLRVMVTTAGRNRAETEELKFLVSFCSTLFWFSLYSIKKQQQRKLKKANRKIYIENWKVMDHWLIWKKGRYSALHTHTHTHSVA